MQFGSGNAPVDKESVHPINKASPVSLLGVTPSVADGGMPVLPML